MAIAGIANIEAARTAFETLTTSAFQTRPAGVWASFTANFTSTDAITLEVDEGTAMPVISEWTGMKVFSGFRVQKQSVRIKTYQASLKLDRKQVERDKTGIVGNKIRQFLGDTAYMPDKLVLESLLSNPTGIDGVSLLNDTHSYGASGGTWDNKVTTALNHASFNTGRAAMRALRDEQGEWLNVDPKVLLVGPANERTALEITGADTRTQVSVTAGAFDPSSGTVGASSPIANVYKALGITVVVSPRFEDGTNSASWFLIDPRFPCMGWFDGGGVRTAIQDQPNDDIPFHEDKNAYTVFLDGKAFGLAPYGVYGRVG